MLSAFHVFLSLCFSFAIAFGQLLFKLSAQTLAAANGSMVERIAHSPLLWFTFAWYGLSSVLWIFILMRVPLSQAYPFSLVGAAIVPIIATLVFKEPLSARYCIGGGFILVGMFLAVGNPGSDHASVTSVGSDVGKSLD